MYLPIVLVGPRRSHYYGLEVAAGLEASIVAVAGGANFFEQDRMCDPRPCVLLHGVEQCGQTICEAAASSAASFLAVWAIAHCAAPEALFRLPPFHALQWPHRFFSLLCSSPHEWHVQVEPTSYFSPGSTASEAFRSTLGVSEEVWMGPRLFLRPLRPASSASLHLAAMRRMISATRKI